MQYPSSSPTSPRATILFADDDPDTCEMMKILLGFQGYEVVTARDGCEAIEVARQKFPQLILLDLEIPKLNGISVAKSLKADPRFRAIPIVMISGHNPATFRQQALEAGCDEYLLKPLDFSRIEELLARSGPIVKTEPQRRRHAVA
jgi:CheY-like chemotaxis protein